MNWLPLLLAAIKLLASLASYLRERRLLSSTDAAVLANVLQEQADEIDKGHAARLARRAGDAGGVPDDGDAFRRD